MSDACYCDYEPATVYRAEERTARKEHRCAECRKPIKPGERYENVFAVWEGVAETCKTCPRCLALRRYIEAIAKCFCFTHHSLLDDALEWGRQYCCEVPGMGMEFGRLYVAAQG